MSEKQKASRLWRRNPETKEGKYLVKRRDGTVVEWPNFVLGARDPHAPAAIRAYADSASKDPGFEKTFIDDLYSLADEFEAYRAEYGNGDPGASRHRKDDPDTIAEMQKGKSA